MPASKKSASVTGPKIGMRYSTFATSAVSPPGVTNWYEGTGFVALHQDRESVLVITPVWRGSHRCSAALHGALSIGTNAIGLIAQISNPRTSFSPPMIEAVEWRQPSCRRSP